MEFISPQHEPSIFSNTIVLRKQLSLAACLFSPTKVKVRKKLPIGESSHINLSPFPEAYQVPFQTVRGEGGCCKSVYEVAFVTQLHL